MGNALMARTVFGDCMHSSMTDYDMKMDMWCPILNLSYYIMQASAKLCVKRSYSTCQGMQ